MSHNYPTPHCHPQSLDTGSTPKAFVQREVELGTGHATATDHGSLAACRQVYDLCKDKKVTGGKPLIPILGVEAYFRDDDCPILTAAGLPKTLYKADSHDEAERDKAAKYPTGTFKDVFKYAHVTVHFLDQASYERGAELLSNADQRAEYHGQERKPLFGWREMEELGGLNTTITSGCLVGMVQRHLLDRDDPHTAIAYYERLRSLTRPGRFYVEIFPHDCSKNYEEGVYLTLASGERVRYAFKKWLRVNSGGAPEEVRAEQLAQRKDWQGYLLAHKHYHTWIEREPAHVVKVEKFSGFIENECKPWSPTTDVQAAANKFMLILAKRYGDPVLVSDDAHYAYPDEKVVQDVRLAQSGAWRFYGSYHRQTSDESFEYFRARLGTTRATFDGWVENNRTWAAQFKDFKFQNEPSLPTKFYPSDTLKHLIGLIRKHGRMNWDDQRQVALLKQEIDLLHCNGTLDLLPYFFMGEEAVDQYAKAGELTGPGRGSAAGLRIAYLIGITHIDPLRYDLSLERFLTLDRVRSGKLPDIDMDFPHRGLLVSEDPANPGWLQRRFGDHYAQISVDSTLKLKMAVKDVARMQLGYVPPDIEALTKRFEMPPQGVSDTDFVFGYTADDGREVKGLLQRAEGEPLREYVAKYPGQWEIVKRCLGLARQKGRHACAFVVANKPIQSFIPLTTVSDVRVTQYTAPSVEASGGVKMDFLVVNSLKDISNAIQMIRERSGVEIPHTAQIDGRAVPWYRLVPYRGRLYDVWDLPEDDAVFRDVVEGRTETVFQFNTPSAIGWLKHFAHNRRDGRPAIASVLDMAAFTALDRPGPLDVNVSNPDVPGLQHNMLVEYARRARGLAPSPDVLPFFDQLCAETYGVMVYQEQLQRIYQYLTGCSGPEAEDFRSNVAKKKMDKVEAAFPFFMKGASEKLGAEVAQAVWGFFLSWGQYGFNKSHAVCYAMIGYVCAWLKHHYPLEWWCGVLRNAEKGEVVGTFWRFCGNLIDLPDLRNAEPDFTIREGRIVAPIRLLHGIGEKAHEQLVAGAPYIDLRDFVQKIEDFKKATGKTENKLVKEKVKRPRRKKGEPAVAPEFIEVVKAVFKPGRSAVNKRVARTLILSGAMDSLLDDETRSGSILDKLLAFERVFSEVTGKKQDPVPEIYGQIGPLGRYILRRQALPAYAEDLRPVMLQMNHPNVRHVQLDDNDYKIMWGNRRLVTYQELLILSNQQPFCECEGAFVAQCTAARMFTYGAQKKTACELTLDIGGETCSMVGWPHQRSGKLPENVGPDLVGSIVVVGWSKWKEGRPPGLDWIEVLERPPRVTTEDEE